MVQEPNKKEYSLEDIGTRFEHLNDHFEALEVCIDVLSKRIFTDSDRQRLMKITMASEVLRDTIDSYMGQNKDTNEYALYKVLNGIPKDPAQVEGGRGTPLKKLQ